MALSIWMLSLAQTSKTIRWHTDLSSDLSSLSIRLRLRKEPPQNRQDLLKQAIDTEWRSAREIAELAGVTYKSAIRYLIALDDDSIDKKMEEWVDSRLRNRKRMIYRRKSMSREEQAQLLNSVLFFNRKPPVIEPPQIVYINPRGWKQLQLFGD